MVRGCNRGEPRPGTSKLELLSTGFRTPGFSGRYRPGDEQWSRHRPAPYNQTVAVDDAAERNRATWRKRCEDLLAVDGRSVPFARACARTLVGTDVTADKLQHFLDQEPPTLVPTPRVVAAVRGQEAASLAVYETAPWGPRRAAVEDFLGARWDCGYGTLDLPPKVGDPTYGPFRLVFRPGDEERQVLVLPHNSAAWYAETGVVDEELFLDDVVAWDGRGDLASVVRSDAADAPEDWPGALADEVTTGNVEHDLIEVVLRDGGRPMAAVDEVRVSASNFDDEAASRYLEALVAEGDVSVDLAVAVAESARSAASNGLFRWTVVH